MKALMEKIHEQVKDNARELKYLQDDHRQMWRKLDKNDQCHTDIKARLNDFNLKINTIENELAPIKKIMWIVLSLLITSVGGAILALVLVR